jgi:hypothetical protein
MTHHATSGRIESGAMSVALLFCLAFLAGCAPSATEPPGAGKSFKKEVLATKESLSASLMDAVANGDTHSARSILKQKCAMAGKSDRPFTCGITVLDRYGILLASATPGEPIKRLDYSRNEIAMKALKDRKIAKTKLYLQDRTTLYVVGIPLMRQGEALGLLVLAFDASDLRERFGLTEDDFMRVDLDG